MRPKKKVTLEDIAREIGVSAVTVSKALSGQKGVSEDVRRRIIKLAGEMGYRQPEHKHQMRERMTIGVLVAERYLEESLSYYWRLYQDLVIAAGSKGHVTILEVVDYRSELRHEKPKLLVEDRVSALVVLGDFHREYQKRLLERAMMPMVSLDTVLDDSCDAVVADNITGGSRMTDYLFHLGHRRIGFVGTRLATRSIEERFLGYVRSLIEHGVEYDPTLVIDDRDRNTGYVILEPYFHLTKEEMPTAFFCNSDLTADHLIKVLQKRGYRVPEEISVVGFDNYIVDERQDTMITTYEMNRKKMAEQTIELLAKQVKQPSAPGGASYIGGVLIEKKSAVRVGPPVPFV